MWSYLPNENMLFWPLGTGLRNQSKNPGTYKFEIILKLTCVIWMYLLITFSYSCNSRENIVYGSNFRNEDFDGFIRYDDSWIRKSHFLVFGVCAYVCVWYCVSAISIT